MLYLETMCKALKDYDTSRRMVTYELDEEQSLQLSYLAWERMSFLEAELNEMFPSLSTYNFSLIPVGVGVITYLGFEAEEYKKYLNSSKDWVGENIGAPVHFANRYLKEVKTIPAIAALQFSVPQAVCDRANKMIVTVLPPLCDLLVQLGKGGFELCQKARPITTAACTVAYVAMISFGHPISGAMGLASIVLMLNKVKGSYDRMLEPVVIAASTVAILTTPMAMVLKIKLLIEQLRETIDTMKKFETTQKWLSNAILDPFSEKFTRDEKDLTAVNTDQLEFRSHLKNSRLTELLPPDYEAQIDAMKPKQLFDDVLNRYLGFMNATSLQDLIEKKEREVEGLSLDDLVEQVILKGDDNARDEFCALLPQDHEVRKVLKQYKSDKHVYFQDRTRMKPSLDNLPSMDSLKPQLVECGKLVLVQPYRDLKEGFSIVRSGVDDTEAEVEFDERAPSDLPKFQRKVKAMLDSMMTLEKESFLTEFDFLCKEGLQCLTAWSGENSRILNVRTDDLEWALHNRLAIYREFLIVEEWQRISRNIGMRSVGGNLNKHVDEAVQAGLYTRLRPYKAEDFHQITPREMLESLWIYFDPAEKFDLLLKYFSSPYAKMSEIAQNLYLKNKYYFQEMVANPLNSKDLFCEMVKADVDVFRAEYADKTKVREWNLFDTLFFMHEIYHVQVSLLVKMLYHWMFKETVEEIKGIEKKYNAKAMVDEISRCINPEDGALGKIKWESIEKWAQEKKLQDVIENGKLTERGVKLLLLDYGFLKEVTV